MLLLSGVVWISVVDIVVFGRLSDVSGSSTMKSLSKAIMPKYGI